MILSQSELAKIQGGAIRYGLYLAIGSAITFIIGIVDGIMRPLKCNK